MSRFILHFSKLFKLFSDLGKYVSPCTPFPSGTKSASGAGRWGLTRQPIPFRFPVCSADGFGFYNNCSHTVILTGEELLPYAVASIKKPKSRWSRMAGYRQRWRFFAEKYDLCLDHLEVGTDIVFENKSKQIWSDGIKKNKPDHPTFQ